MSVVTADRILETSTTTGTGAYTLAGAVTGFRSFSTVCSVGDTLSYFAEGVDSNGVLTGGWEVGTGTFGAGNTLARSVTVSSNANAPVSWVAGTRRIGLGVSAAGLNAKASITYVDALAATTASTAVGDSVAFSILFGAD